MTPAAQSGVAGQEGQTRNMSSDRGGGADGYAPQSVITNTPGVRLYGLPNTGRGIRREFLEQ